MKAPGSMDDSTPLWILLGKGNWGGEGGREEGRWGGGTMKATGPVLVQPGEELTVL